MRDLNEIMVFTKVAELGGFSKATKSLGMPVSTVSRKVSDLEERLGITLLQRTTRKLSLTRSGEQYFKQCADILSGLDEAETQVTKLQSQPEGTLKISVPVGMGAGRFIDFLQEFMAKYPKLEVELLVTNQFVDLVAEGVDVALRFGELSDSSLVARKLGTDRRMLVAAPSYLKKAKPLVHPQDLREHKCILFKSRSIETHWELTREKSRVRVAVKGAVKANDMLTIREFAVNGAGIALLPEMSCIDELASGQLKQVLPEWKTLIAPAHAVYVSRKFLPARIEVFLNAIGEWKQPNWMK